MKNSAKKSSSVLKKIKPYSFYLILALVSAIISVSLTLYIPVLTGNAIDNIIDKGNVDFASVIQILVFIGVGIGGVALFQWIMTYFTNIVSYRTVRDLRREVFDNQLENCPCGCCSHTAFALCCGIHRQDDTQPLYPSTGTQR